MVYPVYNSSGTGMGEFFTYVKSVVPFYDGLMFGSILLILTLSIYFIQESKKGRGDFPVAFAVGSTVTTVLAGIIQLLVGFISPATLGILIGLTVVSYIWLFLSD